MPEPSSATEAARPRRSGPAPLSLSQILDATAACLAESGYDGTTIRRIAARLGCAVGSIYRYCTDKRSLLSAVTQRRFDPVAQAIDDHVSVEHTASQYAALAAEDPQQYRLMFWLASMEPGEPGAGGASRAGVGALPAIVQRIIDGWTRQVGDPRLAQRLWARVHGDVMLGLPVETLRTDVDELVRSRDKRGGSERDETARPTLDEIADGAAVAASPANDDLTLL